MRPIWSGSISLVLVNIPVKLYAGTQRNKVEFDLLHVPDNSRIRYAKVCRQEEKEVPNEEITRGFPLLIKLAPLITKQDTRCWPLSSD